MSSRSDIRRLLSSAPASAPQSQPAGPDRWPIQLAGAQLAFQRRLCAELAAMGIDAYSVDDPADPADLECAAGTIGTLHRVGSWVLKPDEAGRLMALVPDAHACGVRVQITPGCEPAYLDVTFVFV